MTFSLDKAIDEMFGIKKPDEQKTLIELRSPYVYKSAVTIVDLEQHHCKFVLDERDPATDLPLYCGKPRRVDSPYCEDHYHLTFKPDEKAKRIIYHGTP